MQSIDILVQNYFSLARSAFSTEIMLLLSTLFDLSIYFILIALCVTYLVYLVRGFRYSLLFLLTLTVSSLLIYLMKLNFNTTRPLDGVISAFGPSFPSYHAAIATVFFIMLMYVFDDYLKPFFRIIFNAFSIMAIFAVALSRVYLGVHWVSDVSFSIIFGALFSYCSIYLFKVSGKRAL